MIKYKIRYKILALTFKAYIYADSRRSAEHIFIEQYGEIPESIEISED